MKELLWMTWNMGRVFWGMRMEKLLIFCGIKGSLWRSCIVRRSRNIGNRISRRKSKRIHKLVRGLIIIGMWGQSLILLVRRIQRLIIRRLLLESRLWQRKIKGSIRVIGIYIRQERWRVKIRFPLAKIIGTASNNRLKSQGRDRFFHLAIGSSQLQTKTRVKCYRTRLINRWRLQLTVCSIRAIDYLVRVFILIDFEYWIIIIEKSE